MPEDVAKQPSKHSVYLASMAQSEPLVLRAFSSGEFDFVLRNSPEGVTLQGTGLSPKGYVPGAFYTLNLVEGRVKEAWLVGELGGYQVQDTVTVLRFDVLNQAYGDWILRISPSVTVHTCELVGGGQYSLVVKRRLDEGVFLG